MLGNHYIKLNNQVIPNPTNFKIGYANYDNIKQSEAYTDIGTTNRLMKRTFSFSFNSTSRGAELIKTYCAMTEITITVDGTAYHGRLRISGEDLQKDSEYCDRTQGLWVLTVTFTEN